MMRGLSRKGTRRGDTHFQKVVGSIIVLFDNVSPAELGLLLFPEFS